MSKYDIKQEYAEYMKKAISESYTVGEKINSKEVGEYLAGKAVDFVKEKGIEHSEDILIKIFGKTAVKNSRIPASAINDVYSNVGDIKDKLESTADIAKDVAEVIDGMGDLKMYTYEEDTAAYCAALQKTMNGFLGVTQTAMEQVPVCGDFYAAIVGELDKCFDKGYNIVTGHVAELKYIDAMCDYYTGAISTHELLKRLKKIDGLGGFDMKQVDGLADMEEELGKRGIDVGRKGSDGSSQADTWKEKGQQVYDSMTDKERNKYKKGGGSDNWQSDTTDKGKKKNDENMDDADNTQPKRDPLIIDLGEKGIKLSRAEDGVHFDLDNNGTSEKTSWTTGEDGFLALDRNGNGIIDNGSELFGDSVIMQNGERASSGFEALGDYDENEDGVIDSEDTVFSDLRIWVDENSNGITDKGELKTLADENITSIALEHENSERVDGTSGSIITETASVTLADGTMRDISEHWFKVNAYDTTDKSVYSEEDSISSIDSFGNIVSLNSAVYKDKTGRLAKLVDDFKNSINYMEKRILVKEILYTLTNANDIEADSRGTAIDARDLHVVEEFLGRSFKGVEGTSEPNSNAADILRKIYVNVENMYFNLLNDESSIGEYIDTIGYAWANGERYLDTSLFESTVEGMIANGEDPENVLMLGASWLYAYDNAFGKETLAHLKEKFADYADIIDAVSKASVVLGTDEDDTLSGTSGREILYGGLGDDTISGGAGNDTLYGSQGSDNLFGGYGDDTYIFNLGDGADIINEENKNSKADSVVFGDGITAEDITITRDGNDMVLNIGDKGDSIRIVKQYTDSWYRVENFKFANGDKVTADELLAKSLTINGSGEFGDYDSGYGTRNTTLVGSDEIDSIYGYSGDDTLIGGKGNDSLFGGYGNDTYIFNLGDGADIINEENKNSKADSVVFGDGITAEDITVTRDGNDMVLNIGDKGDSIRIVKQYTDSWYRIESIEFESGPVKSVGYEDFENIGDIAAKAQEEALLESGVDALNDLYSEDGLASDIITESNETVIADVAESTSVFDDEKSVADLTDVQALLLVENMSAFADDTAVSEGIRISDITAESSALDQLLISSSTK